MKITKPGIFFALLTLVSLRAFGQMGNLDKFKNALDNMAIIMEKGLISNATLGLNWSDAYIGQLAGVPPHFGIGISAGVTAIPSGKINAVIEELSGSKMDVLAGFVPIPAAAGEIRLGGFLLPFDIGIRALPLPELNLMDNTHFQYTTVGVDLRYAVLQDRGYTPAVSIGAGFNYTGAKLGTSVDQGQTISLEPLNNLPGQQGLWNGKTIRIEDPEMAFQLQNTTLDLKVQVSKRLAIFTFYAGSGLSYGWSSFDFDVTVKNNLNQFGTLPADWRELFKQYTGIEIPADLRGMHKGFKYDGFGFRFYGGLSFNLGWFRIDPAVMYDLVNENLGAGLNIRIQV
jgi:hypothetical protein